MTEDKNKNPRESVESVLSVFYPNGCATIAKMFIIVQKLEFFSKHKSFDLEQFLNLVGLQRLICPGFAFRIRFDTNVLANSNFDRQSNRFKSFNFDAFENISRLVAQRLR